MSTGGGIVFDSDPYDEWVETMVITLSNLSVPMTPDLLLVSLVLHKKNKY